MTQVGKNIKIYRTALKMTQQELADKISVTRQTISGWEQGRTEPDLESLERMSNVLQVSVEELIYGKRKSKEEIKTDWKKRLEIAFVWVGISVVWFIVCQKYVQLCNANLIELDVIDMFLWYDIFKPLRFVLITIAVLSLIRVNVNLYIPWKGLRVVLLAAGVALVTIYIATMAGTWFGDGRNDLRLQMFWFFSNIELYELEIIYVIPAICIYLGVAGDLRKKRVRAPKKMA